MGLPGPVLSLSRKFCESRKTCQTGSRDGLETNSRLIILIMVSRFHSLALIYHSQEKFEKAEPLYWRSLHIISLNQGSEHPDVGAVMNNLAEVLSSQEKYTRAEKLFRKMSGYPDQVIGR